MPEYPDIIFFIMPDQLRADFLRCHDAGFIDTPRIESLADGGVHYNNADTPPTPLCVSRSLSPMTGMDAIKNGVLDKEHCPRSDYRE
jgi:arylsulfatase A-like enzyme